MSTSSPVNIVDQLVQAVNQGNLDAAVACYEADATLIVQPGQVATGKKAIREALAGFIAMKTTITTETRKIIQTDEIALSISMWSAIGTGPDGTPFKIAETSADVLHRQADGKWLIVIDNPFGAAILD